MPALLEPMDDVKIQLARIVGFNSLDQCDSVPQAVLDLVADVWTPTIGQIEEQGITRNELLELGATNL